MTRNIVTATDSMGRVWLLGEEYHDGLRYMDFKTHLVVTPWGSFKRYQDYFEVPTFIRKMMSNKKTQGRA